MLFYSAEHDGGDKTSICIWLSSTWGGASIEVSDGVLTTLMIGTVGANGWGRGGGTGEGEEGGRGGGVGEETIVGPTTTGSGRGEAGEATTAVGVETKVRVEVATLG